MNNDEYPTLADAQALLPDAVLLPIDTGTKKPVRSKWQQTTFPQTQKPGYQRLLSNAGAIGVLLGEPSNWLCVLDCDTAPYLEFMLAENEVLQHTLRTYGARGGGIWFRNLEHTLGRVYVLMVDPKSALATGAKLDEKTGLAKIGELRCGRAQNIICGLHPTNVYYQWPEIQAPIELKPGTLKWPADVALPWQKKAARPRAQAQTAQDAELLQRAKDALLLPVLFKHFGFPEILLDANGCCLTNSPFREDKRPSFSIYENGTKFKDHGTGWQGDGFDFYQHAAGKDASQAFKDFVILAGLRDQLRSARRKPAEPAAGHDPRPLILHPGTDRYISEFAADLGSAHPRRVALGLQSEFHINGVIVQAQDVAADCVATAIDRGPRDLIDDHTSIMHLEDARSKPFELVR
jgi:hypothetical protein